VNNVDGGEKMKKDKKAYTSPNLKKWGKIADLTQTGRTRPGPDFKGGSSGSSGM
jgi:hypothetical protein